MQQKKKKKYIKIKVNMKLKEWLTKEERSKMWLARQLGVVVQTVNNIIAEKDMHLSLAQKIENFTHGEVQIVDLTPKIIKNHKMKARKSLKKSEQEKEKSS